MGGLVVKKVHKSICYCAYIQAIIDAFNNSRSSRICENVKSILFMGTPHRGSDLSLTLANILGMMFVKKVFINELRPNCETITEINHQFGARTKTMELVSFFESTGTRHFGVCLTVLSN